MLNLEEKAMNLFVEVMELSGAKRDKYLHAACAAVPGLRARVEELLIHDREAAKEAFLASPLLPRDPSLEPLPIYFGNYELLELMPCGSQGTVYRARQVHIDKEVALKLVNSKDRRRSLRELRVAADLTHEHLVRVYHVGEHDGQLYFTMKLAEKGSLDRCIDEYCLPGVSATTGAEQEAIDVRKQQIARFMAKIARAVHYIHEQGYIHRDLKPRNILVDASGNPLVADFGLALRFKDNQAERLSLDKADPIEGGTKWDAGTAGYMATEQAQGRTDLGPAVDIYGLGAVLFKLLTSQTPFVGTPAEMIGQTADPERLVPPPSACNANISTGSDLDLICMKCLAKEPERRYRTVAELASDLERFACGEPISIRRVGWLERWTRRVVGVINHKVSIPGIARWGTINLWDAGLNLAANCVLFTLIRTDQPPTLLWITQLTFIVVWWWMFLTYFFRHDVLDQTERHLAQLWGGVTLAGLTLFWLYCPPFGATRAANLLAFYPPWAVVNGLAFLVVGRLYWGRYYLVGLAHFLLAALMPLCLDYAPLVYGVFVTVCMVYGAWDHIDTGRKENRRSTMLP